jgi:hypothetical protein
MAQHAPERVVGARIKPARNENQLRPEGMERGTHDALHRRKIGPVPAARRKRQVDVVTFARALPHFFDRAAIRRIQPVLVQRNRQHARIGVKDLLRTVAMMHVPIDHRDAVDPPLCLRGLSCYRDVGKYRETPAVVGGRMVAAGPHQRISVGQARLEHSPERLEATAGGEARDVITIRAELRGGLASMPASRRTQIPNPLDVCGGVDAEQLGLARRASGDAHQLLRQAADFHEAVQAPLGLRPIKCRISLNHRIKRGTPRVVPSIALVPDVSGAHASFVVDRGRRQTWLAA